MIYIIISIILFVIIAEFQLQRWVNFLRLEYDKSYNWPKKNIITNIITENLDKRPIYTKEEFFIHSLYLYDDLLGTNNKPNTYNNEIRYEKRKEILTKYSIDKIGSRKNSVSRNSSKYISSYGDSLCFCRYVNDNQTWQYNLSKKIKINVRNFGVGNHGLDQAYLKFKRNYEKKN